MHLLLCTTSGVTQLAGGRFKQLLTPPPHPAPLFVLGKRGLPISPAVSRHSPGVLSTQTGSGWNQPDGETNGSTEEEMLKRSDGA